MAPTPICIRVPATTANLGPGFDCLGLALDLWNETTFTLEGEGIRVRAKGEGSGLLQTDERNLVARAALRLFQAVGAPLPDGLTIQAENRIPLGVGMGSSAAAIVTGLMGANAMLNNPVSAEHLLRLASAMDGHPDNAAAAMHGGLTISTNLGEGALALRLGVPALNVVIVVPAIHLPTQVARAALPREVPLSDAVFNISRTAFVIEALRSGDLTLLGKVMEDRLHQPYRLKLIPGGEEAIDAAHRAGAAAAALSGAGPSIVAFATGEATQEIAQAMTQAFEAANIPSRSLMLKLSERGAYFVS
ncbi:MAG TPA: homoserine kinase [Anaerolineaceae bacterium]|nr:homoserine kinase [Anaerolineaceae bacterium]HPN50355.1 homoserine kinase [Anaerolineaceae bacterium]